MTQQPAEIQVKDINHLGIVAGMLDQMGWVDAVNEIVGVHSLEQVSTGQVLKAMILNGLGFVAAPLYLFGCWRFKLMNGELAAIRGIVSPNVAVIMVELNSVGSLDLLQKSSLG